MYVIARDGETIDGLIKRFVRGVQAAGILGEARRRRHFVPEHELRREKLRRAQRRQQRAQSSGAD